MAKIHKVTKKRDITNFETNSYWFQSDVTTKKTWFHILEEYDIRTLDDMIQNPMFDENNRQLRDISRRLYSCDGILRNTIDYMKALPTLDYVVTNYVSDKTSNTHKEIMRYVMRKIKHKQLVRDIILKGCIDGVAFYYLDTGVLKKDNRKYLSKTQATSISEVNALKPKLAKLNVAIKSLPTNYCRILGTRNNYYVVGFDLKYFDNGTESAQDKLKKYPKEIVDAYNKWVNGERKTNSVFVLDNTKTIVHKISSNLDEPWGRPLVLGAIEDIVYSDEFRKTKRNLLDNVNNNIIYETFPEGKTAGTSALTKKQQEEQHNAVKNAVQRRVNSNGTTFFSVAAGTKIGSIETKTDLFDNDYESNLDTKVGTDLGFAASLLNASGTTSFSSQQTNLSLVTSQLFEWIDDIVSEINKVINYNILGLNYINAEINYLPITHLNRGEYFKTAKELFTIGRGSLAYLANCAGLSKEVYFAMLDEQLEEGVMDKYPVNATSYNTSGNQDDNKGGRPTNDNPTNDNTIKSKTNNSNEQPKPNS